MKTVNDAARRFELVIQASFTPVVGQYTSLFFNPQHVKPHLLVVQRNRVDIISAESGLNISSWRLPAAEKIKQIKLSNDFMYMGVLKSAKELEIRTLYQEDPVKIFVFDDEISGSIIGFEWVFPGELIVLLRDEILSYKINTATNEFTKPRKTNITMNWYRYWPETKLLILSSGSQNLFIYKVSPNTVLEPYPNLQVQLPHTRTARGIEPLPIQITRQNIHTFSLYGRHYIGLLNNWFDTPTLSLHHVSTKTWYRKEYELNLSKTGCFYFNNIDNLIIVHNLSQKESQIFDIGAKVSSDPLVESSSELFDCIGDAAELLEQMESNPSKLGWYSMQSNYIVSPQSGRLYTLSPNLQSIVDELLKSTKWSEIQVTNFISRRSLGLDRNVVFKPLRNSLQRICPLNEIRQILEKLIDMHGKYLRKRDIVKQISVSEISSRLSTTSLTTFVPFNNDFGESSFQNDVYVHVFSTSAITVDPTYISLCLVELINTQKALKITVENFIYELLAQTLLENNLHMLLHEFIELNIIPDSIPLATLLASANLDDYCYILSVNMFKRMGCHHDVLALMTSTGRVMDALQYARDTKTIRFLSPLPFLEKALQTGNESMFLNVYQFFEELSLIPDTEINDSRMGGIARYLSIYREIWGPQIEMEQI